MYLDILELHRFYFRSRLGRAAHSALKTQLKRRWTSLKGMNLAGYGFATPFIRHFGEDALRSVSLMPAQQGAFHWPIQTPNVSVLTDENRWPIPTGFLDRLIVAHALEHSDRPASILIEAHRTLALGGRALIIVPNRTGIWARRDNTPFGHGRPYSIDQLERQLREFSLEPIGHSAALYFPPLNRRFWLRSANLIEGVGQRFNAQRLAGAIVIEVEKTAFVVSGRGLGKVGATLGAGSYQGIGQAELRPGDEI